MLSPRWRKAVRDLWCEKLRTLLVLLSITIGVFSIGVILGARSILAREMTASYAAIAPASAVLDTTAFDDEFVAVVRRMQGVREAGGRRIVRARIQIGPDEWLPLFLHAYADYDEIRVNRITPQSGAWPPPDRTLLIERA